MGKLNKQKRKLLNNGYDLEEDSILLIDDEAYDKALIGISSDMRATYDLEVMVKEFADCHHCSEEDALDFIQFNTIRSLPHYGNEAPIVITKLF